MVDGNLPQERQDFYVYVIFRSDGVPCYVGKGRGKRWLRSASTSKNRRLRRIADASADPLPVVKVRESLTEAQAFATEVVLIAVIGRGRRGPLVNFTDGGEGNAGWQPSAETRKKIAKAVEGNVAPPEIRAKMSDAHKARLSEPDARAAHTERARACAADPEWRRRHAEGNARNAADPEWRTRHAEGRKKLSVSASFLASCAADGKRRSAIADARDPGGAKTREAARASKARARARKRGEIVPYMKKGPKPKQSGQDITPNALEFLEAPTASART
jgi:hypothetical protein